MSTVGYYLVKHFGGRVGIRYRGPEQTLTAENVAHRERQALRRTPVAGRVERTDRGALRIRAREAEVAR